MKACRKVIAFMMLCDGKKDVQNWKDVSLSLSDAKLWGFCLGALITVEKVEINASNKMNESTALWSLEKARRIKMQTKWSILLGDPALLCSRPFMVLSKLSTLASDFHRDLPALLLWFPQLCGFSLPSWTFLCVSCQLRLLLSFPCRLTCVCKHL